MIKHIVGRKLAALKRRLRKNPLLYVLFSPFLLIRRYFLSIQKKHKRMVQSFLSEHLAEDPIIRLNHFKGIFIIDRRSDLLRRVLYDENIDLELVDICLKYLDHNKDAIDVGANIGFYTVLFAKNLPLKRVLAVEPAPGALERLKKNIQLNEVKLSTIVFEGIASHARGISDIKIIPGKEEYSTVGELVHPSVSGQPFSIMQVRKERLDELVLSHHLNPGLIKIDAEGGEKWVIEGAERTLKEHRPVIISELSDFLLKRNGTSAKEVMELLESFDYVVKNATHPHAPAGVEEFEDILCIPKERAGIA